MDTLSATLTSVTSLTPRVKQYLLRVEGHTFDFEPGQHASLVREDVGDAPAVRPYSPTNRPGTDTLALAIKRYDGGTVSAWMAERTAGDTIPMLDHLTGHLTLQDPAHDALFCATGTGLTPMLSMLRATLPHGTGRLTLLFGERTEADVMYRATLDAWAASYERFRVRYVLSHPEDGDGAGAAFRTGVVQDHLADALARLDAPHAYVCGVPAMVVETKAALTDAHGLPEDDVFSEGWEENAA